MFSKLENAKGMPFFASCGFSSGTFLYGVINLLLLA